MEVSVRLDNGEVVVLFVPYHVSQICYNDFMDLKKAEQNFRVPALDNEEIEETFDYVAHYTEVVSFVVKGDLSNIPFYIDEPASDNDFEKKLIVLGDKVSLIGLYWHIITLVNSYTGEFTDELVWKYIHGEENVLEGLGNRFEVEYLGEKYYIEPDRAKRLLSLKGYSVGEVLEVEEFERYYKREIDKVGDRMGAFEMALDMSVMAVLLRKDGEKLPVRKIEREQFIQKRGSLFGGLGMDVVIRCLFFLGFSQLELSQILPSMLQLMENPNFFLQGNNGKK